MKRANAVVTTKISNRGPGTSWDFCGYLLRNTLVCVCSHRTHWCSRLRRNVTAANEARALQYATAKIILAKLHNKRNGAFKKNSFMLEWGSKYIHHVRSRRNATSGQHDMGGPWFAPKCIHVAET